MDYEIQTTKWLNLDSLERRLRALETCEIVEHKQFARILSSFISELEEIKENLELELTSVLSRIGVIRCSAGVTTAALVAVTPDGSSQPVGGASRCSL